MKVFAEFIEENGISYRRTTVLQFGDSWDLIGSAVLKNPGSARSINKINDIDFEALTELIHENLVERENWYEFSKDPTMGFLSKVFNGWYIGKEKQLNGVILLFNLYYIKDQNIQSARNKMESNKSKYMFQSAEEIIPLFKDKPVFLGWFNEYNLTEEIKLNAQKIFDFVKSNCNMYLNDELIKNKFYHPLYINRAYNQSSIHETLKTFFDFLK